MAGKVGGQEDKTELRQRIDTELREKLAKPRRTDSEADFDSAALKDSQKTGRFSWFWIILVGLTIVALLTLFFF